MITESFSFQSEGKKLCGILDFPADRKPVGIVMLIHGDGKTNVVVDNWYSEIRTRFTKLVLACCTWDKPGCGKSHGRYYQQSVQDSAKEGSKAIAEVVRGEVPGHDAIGLYGMSRAGWICPLIISEYPSIIFWISVSWTDDKESFAYLLESNLKLKGRSGNQAWQLRDEWIRGARHFLSGGAVGEYLSLTANLRKDECAKRLLGAYRGWQILLGYRRYQKSYLKQKNVFDEQTGLQLYVSDFAKILERIQCPVLAIFGEKDTNVDWRKTEKLYLDTIGRKGAALLTVKRFPDGDHCIQKCVTGAINEQKYGRAICDGFFESMESWLIDRINGLAPVEGLTSTKPSSPPLEMHT